MTQNKYLSPPSVHSGLISSVRHPCNEQMTSQHMHGGIEGRYPAAKKYTDQKKLKLERGKTVS